MRRQGQDQEPSDTGRLGYRERDEYPDGRPVISHSQFWSDEAERLTYEHALQSNPKREDEGVMSYIMRIAAVVEGRYRKAGTMPRGRLSQRAYERRMRELEGQR